MDVMYLLRLLLWRWVGGTVVFGLLFEFGDRGGVGFEDKLSL